MTPINVILSTIIYLWLHESFICDWTNCIKTKNHCMKKNLLVVLGVLVTLSTIAQDQSQNEKKSFLSVNLGPSIPLGDFASATLDNEEAGFSLTGITLDLNYLYSFHKNVGLAVSGFYNMNGLDISKLREATGVSSLKMDHWQFIGLAAGPAFSFDMSPKVMGDVRIMGGLATANSPDVKTNGTTLIPEDWATSGLLQAGFGCRVNIGTNTFFTGGIDYRYLRPTFKVNVDNEIMSAEQNMSMLNLTVGIGFKF